MAHRSVADVLNRHLRRHPLLRARDIYKLVHQGVFGPGHIIASAVSARRMLKEEMAALKVRSQKSKAKSQSSGEELIEPIDPGGRLVRVNLRPLTGQRRMQDVEWLVEAMVESARRVKGESRVVKRRLAAAVRWCRGNLPAEAVELERICAQAEAAGYPAFHHSPAYARAYRPAYRVVLSDCLERRVSGRGREPGRQSRAAVAAGR